MPIRPCPHCANSTPRWLEKTVTSPFVNYYRCDRCGCVWTLPKDKPDDPPTIVGGGRKPA